MSINMNIKTNFFHEIIEGVSRNWGYMLQKSLLLRYKEKCSRESHVCPSMELAIFGLKETSNPANIPIETMKAL